MNFDPKGSFSFKLSPNITPSIKTKKSIASYLDTITLGQEFDMFPAIFSHPQPLPSFQSSELLFKKNLTEISEEAEISEVEAEFPSFKTNDATKRTIQIHRKETNKKPKIKTFVDLSQRSKPLDESIEISDSEVNETLSKPPIKVAKKARSKKDRNSIIVQNINFSNSNLAKSHVIKDIENKDDLQNNLKSKMDNFIDFNSKLNELQSLIDIKESVLKKALDVPEYLLNKKECGNLKSEIDDLKNQFEIILENSRTLLSEYKRLTKKMK